MGAPAKVATGLVRLAPLTSLPSTVCVCACVRACVRCLLITPCTMCCWCLLLVSQFLSDVVSIGLDTALPTQSRAIISASTGFKTPSAPALVVTVTPSLPTLAPDVYTAVEDLRSESRLTARGMLRVVKHTREEAEDRERGFVERYLNSSDRQKLLAEVCASARVLFGEGAKRDGPPTVRCSTLASFRR